MPLRILTCLALVEALSRRREVQPPGEYKGEQKIVVFSENADPEQQLSIIDNFGGRLVKQLDLAGAALVDFEPGRATPQIMAAHPMVETVEEDYPVSLCALPSKKAKIPWGVRRMEAPQAWGSATGDGLRVAAIDTGIDPNHPDLKSNYAGGVNLIEPGKPPLDDNGHGTHVAGILAGAGSRGGVTGVAPRARLYAVKAFDRNGGGRVSTVLEAIQWCVEQGLRLVNMSFGLPKDSLALRKLVKKAYAKGLLMVAAAGNTGKKNDVLFPARYPEILSVSALTKESRIASFSSYGPEVKVIAPGEEIESTFPGGKYEFLNGTSMAAPHVTGTAALLLSINPRLAADQVRQIIIDNSRLQQGLTQEQQGAGLPSAYLVTRAALKR